MKIDITAKEGPLKMGQVIAIEDALEAWAHEHGFIVSFDLTDPEVERITISLPLEVEDGNTQATSEG